MGAFPTSPAPADLKIQSVQPTRVSQSQAMNLSVRETGAQRWALSATWAPMTRAQFAPISAFVAAQKGRAGVFTWTLPVFQTPLGVATGTPVVAGDDQTGTSIVTSGWTHSVTGILKAGDYLHVAGQSKVYQVADDCDSDETGNATISIIPGLMVSPADASAITVNNVPFTLSLGSDTFEYQVTNRGGNDDRASKMFVFSLQMVEAF
ncbi:hypothetical protein [Candidatus Magnetaquicoccus inordinatus]|uniref:hypothetical protein n=1 Tax=Candidatus Magnetaquicoccus inordinatus TaxID=2496818 RepID=UPI00102B79AB|nr:hypothetical protein [Candidatus Magnetaquicoccus inordinatus]